MKKLAFALIVSLSFSILASGISLAAGPYDALAPVSLRYGNGAALGAAGDLWGIAFCKYVEEITNKKITVDYFGNSQLGVDNELQTQMQAGDIDIVSCQPGQTTTFVPAVAVYDLPLAFAKYDAAAIDKALNNSPFTKMINDKYGESKMVCLGVLQGATFRVMTSNVKITKLDDFKGIKIRTMNSPNHLLFWESLGANPTPLPFTELYMSLQQGVVQAQENANDTNLSSNFQEVQKYLVNIKQLLYMNQFLMNKAKFESLDPAYQDAIREAVAKASAEIAPQLTAIDSGNRDKLVAGGMEELNFDDKFYDDVIKASQPVYDEIRKQIGGDIVDALLNALEGK
ncbi:MAG: TRAP transporter substrate-binding protein [Synergistaceae bacterium]|jgi:tripartite ATP-independent transporter DctP family solute receptor|nr:TRAP transporter substrate-binding protein [Synergistaceae bacterium]